MSAAIDLAGRIAAVDRDAQGVRAVAERLGALAFPGCGSLAGSIGRRYSHADTVLLEA